MAKQIIAVTLIIFFAAVGMQATAQDPNNVPAAAANIAPAAAAAGLNITNADDVIGALKGAAADGAPIGGPIPEGVFKNLGPAAAGPPKDFAASLGAATAATGALAAAGIVGSFFFY